MTFRRILIAVERGRTAEHAVAVGVDLARTLQAETAIVHTVDSALGFAPDTGMTPGEHLALERVEGERFLVELRARLAIQPLPVEFLRVGNPGHEIVKVVNEWPADLVVIGSHGRGGVARAVLGSVAEYVMRHASCPVLVVRQKP
jgi:universal stress protein A